MRIVVTTPTGNVGSRVVRLLIQAGERPVLIARDPGRLDPETAARVDVVQGDLLDAGDVLRATAGADALYWVNPPAPFDGDPLALHATAGANAARAVREHGIARVVFQSSVGAELRHGAGDIDGLGQTEELLDATGASVTHLRCGYFFTNLLLDPAGLEEGVIRTAFALDLPLAWVDPRDVGDVAAARLLSTSWSGRHVQAVHGPEHLTFADAAAIAGAARGRPLRAEHVDAAALRAGLQGAGASAAFADAMAGMAAGLSAHAPADERTIVTTTPTHLAAWAAVHLRA